MRIDGVSPTPSADLKPAVKAIPASAAPVVKDRVETQSRPNSMSVLVEMQPGNIVVYKFIDEASGRLIQQIPSEQMMNLSELAESAKGKQKS